MVLQQCQCQYNANWPIARFVASYHTLWSIADAHCPFEQIARCFDPKRRWNSNTNSHDPINVLMILSVFVNANSYDDDGDDDDDDDTKWCVAQISLENQYVPA
jgi:hypothetical protein